MNRLTIVLITLVTMLLLISGCGTTVRYVNSTEPIVIANNHIIQEKVVLPNKPVCSINETNLIKIKWYQLTNSDGSTVPSIYIIKQQDMDGLTYNINNLLTCISIYETYADTVNAIIDTYNKEIDNSSNANINK